VLKAGLRVCGFVTIGIMLAGCATHDAGSVFEHDAITQFSSYNGLLASLYDGDISYAELEPYGDFGLGTFDKMDGEMVMLDGIVYQIDFAGHVNVMDRSCTTPYATLAHFHADQEIPLPPGLSYDEATRLIEGKLENPNAPHAVRIDGLFSRIKCRSVPAQSKPYPPLAEIAKGQAIFEAEGMPGTVVGFRYPAYAGAFNVPGFHCHFLSDDRAFGGHVLGFTTGEGSVARVDRCTRLMVFIPDSEAARQADLNKDRSAEVMSVNRSR